MTNEQVTEYSNLIYSITKYFPNYKNKDDLYQAGCMGLLMAYNNFNKSEGVKFSSYAYTYILGEMKRLVREDKGIKISRNITKLYLKLEKAKILLSQKLMREPTTAELARYLELEEYVVQEAINSINSLQSLDEPIKKDEKDMSLYEIYGEEQDMDTQIILKDSLDNLNKEELKLLRLRYIDGMSQTTIAKNLNMSQVQVSRYETKIKTKLKQELM